MLWFILDDYMGYLKSMQGFKSVPKIKTEMEDANEAEGEDLIVAFNKSFEVAPPLYSLDDCIKYGFLLKPQVIMDIIGDLSRRVEVAARRAPKHILSIPLVDCSYRSYFASFKNSCLWVRKEKPNEGGEMWYSQYFPAH
jgi:hypothetical protein